MFQNVFGRLPAGEQLEKIRQSPNYKKGQFQNIHATPVMAEDSSFWKTLRSYLNKPKNTRPPSPLPFVKTDLGKLTDDAPLLIWFGHSSYLLRLQGYNILVDPVFSNHAAPFSFMVEAYPGADTYRAADMPDIDLLVQTHDHYDHLDYETITALRPKIKKVVTALGTGAHFESWGYRRLAITELDWGQSATPLPGLELTATPARHFSGRGIARGKTLWASFVLKTPDLTIFLGGDSGYDTHFRAIGQQYGPFDLAVLECGQYNVHWKYIHMMPEETVQAAIDLKAALLLPVHWAKFTLALHPWDEPIKRVVQKAAEEKLPVATPLIGQVISLGKPMPTARWWELEHAS